MTTEKGFWLWAKRAGIVAGAIVGISAASGVIGSVSGFFWSKATQPLIDRITAESSTRARIDSLLFVQIQHMESDVVMLGRAWLSEPGSREERRATRHFNRQHPTDEGPEAPGEVP